MKVAFVAPWYGEGIPGGAEAETRRLVEQLSGDGLPIEVLTTCVRDFNADWGRNYHRPGKDKQEGVIVRRFPVRRRDKAAFDAVNQKLVWGLPVTREEEEIYVRESVCSPALTDYVGKHRDAYVYLFIPYLFGTTYWGMDACDGRAILIPCLHDEAYARMKLIEAMFAKAERIIFHTESELELARKLYTLREDAPRLVGTGVDTGWTANAGDFREKYGLAQPFILYAGRKEPGKNVERLIAYFRRYRQRNPKVALVLIGGGEPPMAVSPGEAIYDLGFLSVQDKYDAYAAATVLCQPSLKESFSIVLMEAWMAEIPVLVSGYCRVTREHCLRSNGGLYFTNYPEFEVSLDLLLGKPRMRQALGANGRRYVLENYRWDLIVERYRRLIREMGAV